MRDEITELWRAAITLPGAVELLRRRLNLSRETRDIYLAYSATMSVQFAGYLVTEVGNMDGLIAFCPISSDVCIASAQWFKDVAAQLSVALAVVRRELDPEHHHNVIWLEKLISHSREVPSWIYSLACAPINFTWDGQYRYPRPFCPRLFEALARQPEAVTWLRKQVDASHLAM
jgi:hypothetical protein